MDKAGPTPAAIMSPLQSIWDCNEMKKTVDPATNKKHMKHNHCRTIAQHNATKLAFHDANKRGGDTKKVRKLIQKFAAKDTLISSTK